MLRSLFIFLRIIGLVNPQSLQNCSFEGKFVLFFVFRLSIPNALVRRSTKKCKARFAFAKALMLCLLSLPSSKSEIEYSK